MSGEYTSFPGVGVLTRRKLPISPFYSAMTPPPTQPSEPVGDQAHTLAGHILHPTSICVRRIASNPLPALELPTARAKRLA